jgi:hypothetical protein
MSIDVTADGTRLSDRVAEEIRAWMGRRRMSQAQRSARPRGSGRCPPTLMRHRNLASTQGYTLITSEQRRAAVNALPVLTGASLPGSSRQGRPQTA